MGKLAVNYGFSPKSVKRFSPGSMSLKNLTIMLLRACMVTQIHVVNLFPGNVVYIPSVKIWRGGGGGQ